MLVLGDYLKLALALPDASVSKSRFYMINPDACRLAQFPVYIDKVRTDLGTFPKGNNEHQERSRKV